MIEVVKFAIIRKRTERRLDSNSDAHGLRWTRRRNATVFYALANIVTDAGCRDRGGSADGGNAPACGTPYDSHPQDPAFFVLHLGQPIAASSMPGLAKSSFEYSDRISLCSVTNAALHLSSIAPCLVLVTPFGIPHE
jgi:hypothetical protein